MVSASNIMDLLTGCAFTFLGFPFGLSVWKFSARCFVPLQDKPWLVGRVLMLFLSGYLYIQFFACIENLFFSRIALPGESTGARAFGIGCLIGVVLFVLTVRGRQSKNKKTKCVEEWVEKELPEIVGECGAVIVRCRPFPFRQKAGGEQRKFLYPNFGSDFRHELMDVQLSDWQALTKKFEQTGRIVVSVPMSKCDPITVEVDCSKQLRAPQFFSELADAIIDAMEKNKILP